MAKATVVGLKRGAERPANVERRVPPPNLPNTCEHPILNLLREATAGRNFGAVIPAHEGQQAPGANPSALRPMFHCRNIGTRVEHQRCRGVERIKSENEEAFSTLGCGSAGFIDRRGNGARPVSEQSTEGAGNIWTEQRKPK
jgi:hypothetical protein